MERKLTTDDEWSAAIGDAHAVVLMRERSPFRQREFALAPSLRFISQIGRGIPHLDLAEATRRGIVVSCTPNDSGASTVELTWALLLALARQIPSVGQGMRDGAWPPAVGMLLEGRTLGVIGLGRIGTKVARIARAFDMNVLATGKTLTDERAAETGARRVSLDALLEESDIVTVHCRLNAETRGLIGRPELQRMKPDALLINTARGPIVSEEALVESLEAGASGRGRSRRLRRGAAAGRPSVARFRQRPPGFAPGLRRGPDPAPALPGGARQPHPVHRGRAGGCRQPGRGIPLSLWERVGVRGSRYDSASALRKRSRYSVL